MFIANINDVDHKVFFKHEKQPENHPTATRCTIVNKDTDATVAEAEARCNPIDRFEYTIGRKLAFKRALDNAGFTRDERSAAWAAYNPK